VKGILSLLSEDGAGNVTIIDDDLYDEVDDDDNDHSDDDIVGAIIYRFILMPPGECNNIDLYPISHPSERHSQLNWTDIDYLRSDRKFYASLAIEFKKLLQYTEFK